MTVGPTHSTRRAVTLAALAMALPAAARSPGSVFAFVGAYGPDGGAIHRFRLDLASGRLTSIGMTGDIANPSWLCLDHARRRLFAVSEVDNFGGAPVGGVASYAIGADGGLARINAVSATAAGPAHASLHPSGRWLLVANYAGGSVAVIPISADGALGEASDAVLAPRAPDRPAAPDPTGNLAVSDRSRPHMHMIAPDPVGRFVLATDAGSDRLYVWRLDAAAGRLIPASIPMVETPAGSAPRHFAFHPSGRMLYLLCEHDSRIRCYRYAPQTGGLDFATAVDTLPAGFAGSHLASEIAVSPDGRFVYAANRLRDAIAAFAIGPDLSLRRLGETWTQGDYPRGFGLCANGAWVIACNQRSDSLTSFRRDRASGRLDFTGAFTPVAGPASIVFDL